jgi:phage shock protein C
MDRRLLRNEHDKIIAGVSSGTAEYMQVDVTIIRLLFVLSTIFLFGTGILVYLVMWIVVPVNNDPAARFSKFNDYFKNQSKPSPFQPGTFNQGPASTPGTQSNTFGAGYDPNSSFTPPNAAKPFAKNNDTGRTVGGLFLLVIGIYFLLNQFDFIPFWFSLDKLWPLVFVAIGLSFILKSKNKNDWQDWKDQEEWKSEQTQAPAAEPTVNASPYAQEAKKSTIDLNKDNETQTSTNNPL